MGGRRGEERSERASTFLYRSHIARSLALYVSLIALSLALFVFLGENEKVHVREAQKTGAKCTHRLRSIGEAKEKDCSERLRSSGAIQGRNIDSQSESQEEARLMEHSPIRQ